MNKIYDILENLRPEFIFKESADFVADGMLDSYDIVMLVTELENTFNIFIDGLDIVPENFVSVTSIQNLVRKSGGII